MHTKSGLLTEIPAATDDVAAAEQDGARLRQGARLRAGSGAAVRQQHRHGPPVPRPLHARARQLPALPQRRRVVVQGAVPALVSRGLPEAAGQGRAAPRARRHPGVDRGAALLPRRDASSPAPTDAAPDDRRAPTPPAAGAAATQLEQSRERAEQRRHRALAGRVAHQADAPALARRDRRARRRPRCRSGCAARRAPCRRRRRRAARPT